MQSRCCWPPESASADWRAGGPSPRPTARRAAAICSTRLVELALVAHRRRCAGRRRRSRRSTSGTGSTSGTPCRRGGAGRRRRRRRRRCRCRRCATRPSTRAPGMMSFIRLRQRRNVDLPQPDGPMNAVTRFSGSSSEMSCSALVGRSRSDSSRTSIFGASGLAACGSGARRHRARDRRRSSSMVMAGSSARGAAWPGARGSRARGSIVTSTSAPAHACRCQSSYGEIA